MLRGRRRERRETGRARIVRPLDDPSQPSREYLRHLSTIVLGEKQGNPGAQYLFVSFGGEGSYPADAKSLARMHLRQIGRLIDQKLATKALSLTTPPPPS